MINNEKCILRRLIYINRFTFQTTIWSRPPRTDFRLLPSTFRICLWSVVQIRPWVGRSILDGPNSSNSANRCEQLFGGACPDDDFLKCLPSPTVFITRLNSGIKNGPHTFTFENFYDPKSEPSIYVQGTEFHPLWHLFLGFTTASTMTLYKCLFDDRLKQNRENEFR